MNGFLFTQRDNIVKHLVQALEICLICYLGSNLLFCICAYSLWLYLCRVCCYFSCS